MEYYIYWDEDYNGSDRDELLEIVNSEEEKEKFIDDWCTRKADSTFKGLRSEDKEYVKKLFKEQLFVADKPRYSV